MVRQYADSAQASPLVLTVGENGPVY